MMLLAHIFGIPVEEFLTPMAGGAVWAVLVASAAYLARLRGRFRPR
ncbi:MAG TPA: hypothetical protein VME66_07500 [Candidatus Acidoferrales bacterium]|nr:hypothetical protein [Candidatus Acidoferrales bacterium]